MRHPPVVRLATASAVLALTLLAACSDQPLRPSSPVPSAAPAGPVSSYHVLSQPWSTYDQIYAGSQVSEPDDDFRIRCPEERPIYGRVWKITLLAGQLPGSNRPDYMAHFEFAGEKYFIGYVGRADNGDPLADYRIYETVYSTDRRYRAEPYARLTLMCHGRYTRFPGGRVWAGNYTVVAHEGEVTFGPAYSPYNGDGAGGCGDPAYMTGVGPDTASVQPISLYESSYDPYDPGPPLCGGGGGSGRDGSKEETFPEACSSLGGKLYYDYICLQLWNESTGSYETVWCGVAAICET